MFAVETTTPLPSGSKLIFASVLVDDIVVPSKFKLPMFVSLGKLVTPVKPIYL